MDDLQGGTLALEHRYDLRKRAGEFALFSIYKGVQHPFERPIWVKVCGAPSEYRAPDFYDRLKRSVLEAAAFEHDGVLEIVDFGDFETHVPFVVTQRAEGVPLVDLLADQGTLAPEDAVQLLRSVARIVSAAHAEGLVHGGIAPRWITVADDGAVFLDHFRLHPTMAEIREMEGAILSDDLLWPLPPEQFGDEAVEPEVRADIWALGALGYWMLSGVHPYFDEPTDTSDAVLRLRNRSSAPSLDELGVDEELSEVVARALASKIEDRFDSVDEFLDALPGADRKRELGRTDSPSGQLPAAPVPARSDDEPRRIGTIAAVAFAALVVTNIGWFFYHTATDDDAEVAVSEPAGAPSILPVGVQLRTEPPTAKVFRHTEEGGEVEFGDTPMVLDPKVAGADELKLTLRQHGYQDVDLEVRETPEGHDLTVKLRDATPPAPQQ